MQITVSEKRSMINQHVSLILVYEPATTSGRPTPLARIADPQLILAVAEQAINDAISRATFLSDSDEVLGELECAEVDRLRAVLSALIPELRSSKKEGNATLM
jgi:hypothetical protein